MFVIASGYTIKSFTYTATPCLILIAVLIFTLIYIHIKKKKTHQKVKFKGVALQENSENQFVSDEIFETYEVYKIITEKYEHIGTREIQQDASFVSESVKFKDGEQIKVLGVLCDGMGGLKGGELASNTAVNVIAEEFNEIGDDISVFLKNAIYKANKAVYSLKTENGELGKSGTTLVAVVICNNLLYWASIGDSRIYIIRQGEIAQLTTDHNYFMRLMDKVKNNEITLDEAMAHPKKEALISYLGMEKLEIVEMNNTAFELQDNDILLLCSDGLTKKLSDSEILEAVMCNSNDLRESARFLTVLSFDKNFDLGMRSQDNTSVILIQLKKTIHNNRLREC